jgi:hypothetical protein
MLCCCTFNCIDGHLAVAHFWMSSAASNPSANSCPLRGILMNVVKFVKYMLQMFSSILEFAANDTNELICFPVMP